MSLKRLQKRVTASTGLFSSKDEADSFREKVLIYKLDIDVASGFRFCFADVYQ